MTTDNRARTRPILSFDESFAGGFFRFARTYGAVARFEAESIGTLEADWPAALQHTAAWRAHRGDQAVSLHLHVVVPKELAWDAIAFLAGKLLTTAAPQDGCGAADPSGAAPQDGYGAADPSGAAPFPAEFTGLRLEPVVFATPGMQVYLGMTINSEATARSG